MKTLVLAVLALAFTALPLGGAVAPLPAQVAAVHHVDMMAGPGGVFLFNPPVLRVAPGDTVVFHSRDIAHTATSGITQETEPAEGAVPNANAFHTGNVLGGSSASVVIPGPGAFPYYCNVGLHRHLGMHGLILAA